jgi:hypothetical protein
MKKPRNATILTALLAAASLALSGCGGGGSVDFASSPDWSEAVYNLSWDPPDSFVDGTPLIPTSDLDHYEIYLRKDPNFSDEDVEVAQVAAAAQKLSVQDFALDNLLHLTNGTGSYYVAVRAVGVNGMKSEFSDPAEWSL